MSGQGSSSSDTVVRIEVYLDDGTEAVRVLTAPPFRFQLDTAELAEGAHTVRLVRIDAAGGRRERRIPFTVQHESAVEVRGLEPGATVSGRIDVDVVAPAAPPPPAARPSGPPNWLYVLATIIVLGGIWVFFMVVPIYSHVVSPPEASGGGSTAQAAGPPVDQALLKAGDTLYSSDCAACHKPTGEGMPPTFPALAGNSFLSDASAVVKKVYEGGGAMPSHPSYTTEDLAAVATYIRNTWGNSFGGVSVADAASAEPKASSPASTPATGTATSTATSPATGTATSTATSPATGTATSTSTSTATATPAGQAAGAGTQAMMSAGKTLYDSDCASCHQPNGAGIPPTFPALAGNAFLSDATAVVQRIFDGKGTMPAHPSYTAKDLAAVATYVRNAFGNSYGAVTLQEASQAAPKAGQ